MIILINPGINQLTNTSLKKANSDFGPNFNFILLEKFFSLLFISPFHLHSRLFSIHLLF